MKKSNSNNSTFNSMETPDMTVTSFLNTDTRRSSLTDSQPVDVVCIQESHSLGTELFSEEEYSKKTPEEIKSYVDDAVVSIGRAFMRLAYLLDFVNTNKLYKDPAFGCYPSLGTFVEAEYKIKKTQAYNYINVWKCFGDPHRPMQCQQEYQNYSMTQLLVIKDLSEDDRSNISPTMSVREMKQLLPKKKHTAESARFISSNASFQEKLEHAVNQAIIWSDTNLTLQKLTKILEDREFLLDDQTSMECFVFDLAVRYSNQSY